MQTCCLWSLQTSLGISRNLSERQKIAQSEFSPSLSGHSEAICLYFCESRQSFLFMSHIWKIRITHYTKNSSGANFSFGHLSLCHSYSSILRSGFVCVCFVGVCVLACLCVFGSVCVPMQACLCVCVCVVSKAVRWRINIYHLCFCPPSTDSSVFYRLWSSAMGFFNFLLLCF